MPLVERGVVGGASSRMPQVSAAERRFCELRREARGDGSRAAWWRERFRLGSSRRLTLQGFARGVNQPGLEFVLQTGWLNGTI